MPIVFQLNKILIDAGIYFEPEPLIRCDIEPESVEKCIDVENEPISEQKRPLGRIFKHRSAFLRITTAF
jgi:hypothetical protein